MKIFHLTFIILFFFTFPGLSDGQNLKENELVVIQGEKFILHQVRTGETIFSISRDFKIDSPQLLKFNPKISEGLSIGDILKIPFNENADVSAIPAFKKGDPTNFLDYTIATKSETAYSISKKFGITVEELYAYNPSVINLKKGITLKIPQWNYKSGTVKEGPKNVETTGLNQGTQQPVLFEHVVVSGETLYSIGKRYGISESEILNFNPEAKNLKAGMKLKLPQKDGNIAPVQGVTSGKNQTGYIEHRIVSGETLYGIGQKYQVSTDELINVNPELKTSFRAGVLIKIPVQENTSVQEQASNENAKVNQPKEKSGEIKSEKNGGGCQQGSGTSFAGTAKVALFLPLFLDANEQMNKENVAEETDTLQQTEEISEALTDTVVEEVKPVQLLKQFYGNSENFLQFYEGVLIAVDSMQKAGMKIELDVYDTKDNPETIRNIVKSGDFTATDLIIGPVYENVQSEVAGIAAQNRIPLISPFTPKSDLINSNPEFYQINPTREYLAEATAEMIAKDYANTNFIVVKTSAYDGKPEEQLVKLIRSKLARSADNHDGKFTEYDFRKERANGLRNILLTDKENVIFIPSSDEGELSVAISNINNLSDEYPITLIGSGNYQQRYPSIEVAHYHNLKFRYINPYWIEYDDSPTIKYFEKFITDFGTEPNSYGVQGFDVAYYFLNALNRFGKDFEDCLPFMKIKLLQGNYYFKKVSPSGGYMNQGVSEISYTRNFEITRQRVIGKPETEE